MRSTALPAVLAPIKPPPALIGHASREALSRFASERDLRAQNNNAILSTL
jgi:hypothetical protein